MSTRKSLFAAAAMALAMMAFASSAMASNKVIDAATGADIPVGEKLHLKGWAKFSGFIGSYECDVTAESEAVSATTGKVTSFTVPDTTKCVGTGFFNGCTLANHSANTPHKLTATASDFDVTKTEPAAGNIVIVNDFSNCTDVELTFSSVTLRPLKTGTSSITGTNGNLSKGSTTAAGEPIAGVEISASGTAHRGGVSSGVTATGELEVTGSDLCTWRLN